MRKLAFALIVTLLIAVISQVQAVEWKTEDPSTYNERGMDLLNHGEYEEAIKCFDRAIQIDPNYATTWNNKGLALDSLGRYEEANPCMVSIEDAHEVHSCYGLEPIGMNNEFVIGHKHGRLYKFSLDKVQEKWSVYNPEVIGVNDRHVVVREYNMFYKIPMGDLDDAYPWELYPVIGINDQYVVGYYKEKLSKVSVRGLFTTIIYDDLSPIVGVNNEYLIGYNGDDLWRLQLSRVKEISSTRNFEPKWVNDNYLIGYRNNFIYKVPLEKLASGNPKDFIGVTDSYIVGYP